MGAGYHQFCPVAKAMELLDERWTLLVVRELACGSERFNEFRRGLPRMSPSLLSKRLAQLTRAGVVERHSDGTDVRYALTPAGLELRPVVEALGAWGVRWVGELGDEDLDPQLLLWDMHRNVDHAVVPDGRTVVRFTFAGGPPRARSWWMVIDGGEVDVCDADPGHPVTVEIATDLRRMVAIWRGDENWADALKSGAMVVSGAERFRRALPGWFRLPQYASATRPQAASAARPQAASATRPQTESAPRPAVTPA